MNIQYAFEHINQKVFRTIYPENISTIEIMDMKNTYPYFMFTRYLLAYRKKEGFQSTTLEASLHSDPLWFGYVLENIYKKQKIVLTKKDTAINNDINKTIDNNLNISIEKTSIEPIIIPYTLNILPAEKIAITKVSKVDNPIPLINEYILLPMLEMVNLLSTENTTTLKQEIKIEPISTTKLEKTNAEQEQNTRTSFVPLYVEDYFGALNKSLPEPIVYKKLPESKPSKNQKPFLDWLDEFSYSYKKSNSVSSSEKNDIPVASETMAEIWVAENRYDKAIATYEKLSLLFPEKSIYFAQKISELKNILK